MAKIKRQFLHYFLVSFLLLLFIFLISILFASILFWNAESVKYCFSNCEQLNGEKLNKKELNETEKYEAEKEEETPYSFWQQCMNPKLDPCDDFYEYSCSKYTGTYVFPNHTGSRYQTYLTNLIDNQINKCFIDTFESDKSNSSSAVQKMRRYQKEYEKTRGVSEEISTLNLIDEIESFGSCPALSLKNEWDNIGIPNILLKMTNLTGLPYLYEIDWKVFSIEKVFIVIEPSRLIFSTPSSTLKSSYYDKTVLKLNQEKKIRQFFVQIFELIAKTVKEIDGEEKKEKFNYDNVGSGSGEDDYYENYYENEIEPKNYTKIAQELVDLELKLIQIYNKWNYFEWGTKTYTLQNLNQIEYTQKFGIFNIENYLLNNSRISHKFNKYLYQNGYHIGVNDYFINDDIVDELTSLFRKLDNKILANYLCLRYVLDRMPYLNWEFKKLATEFERNFRGEIHQLVPTYNWNTKQHIESTFPLPSDHLFVTHCKSSPNQLEKAQEIVDRILKVAIKFIENAEWLDLASQENVIKKLNSTLIAVGASEIALNQTKLDEMYEKLDFQESDSFMEMQRKLQLFNSWHKLSPLHAYENHANFKVMHERASENNAFAEKQFPYIFLALGGLFPPNFDIDQPFSNAYATLGGTAAHELFHLLDNTGVNYIFDGTEQSIFDDPETEADFTDRTSCLEKQYSRQKDTSGLNLDGIKTLKENIADNVAIRVSYYAYLEHLKRNGEDKKVLGYSHYTHEQSFFINFAMPYCSTLTPWERRSNIIKEAHTLPNYRVNMPLKNFPAFSRAFNCSIGTKMNPRKKCRVWKKKK